MSNNPIPRKFPLSQQLFVIVAFILGFFLIFSQYYLNNAIDHFSSEQIYALIENSQKNVIYNYSLGMEDKDIFGINDPNVIHIIKTKDGDIYSNGTERIDEELLRQITLQMDGDKLYNGIRYQYSDGSLYTITSTSDGTTITTLVSKGYSQEFRSMLTSTIVNIILIFMLVIFTVMIFWVTSIIHPLNQIREYVNKIRRKEKAELRVIRPDEIGELASVVVEMNSELQRQQKSKEEMIQNISHDLKTPIATIKSYGESIKDGVYPYETLEKSVDVIIEHANRLENKVHNLLTLNRMDYLTNDSETFESLDIKEIAEKVIVSTSQLRPDIDVELLHQDNNEVLGLEEPWRVVLENLLDNALRYAKSKVIIEVDDHYISVYNDGSNIDVGRLNSLFNAFEKGEGGQFGLGLSIVKRVVDNYEYQIEVKNIDDGVKFEIYKGETNEK